MGDLGDEGPASGDDDAAAGGELGGLAAAIVGCHGVAPITISSGRHNSNDPAAETCLVASAVSTAHTLNACKSRSMHETPPAAALITATHFPPIVDYLPTKPDKHVAKQ